MIVNNNKNYSILLIEDDISSANYLHQRLTYCGFHVTHIDDGNAGLKQACGQAFDLMIIDRMLPSCDGLTIVKSLRELKIVTPVLLLSALAEVNHRIEGLRAGGDDYLTKPYAFDELLARIESLLRRHQSNALINVHQPPKLTVDDLTLNQLNHEVRRANELIRLQPKELRLLEYLLQHTDQLVTRTMLLEQVWGIQFDPETSIIDTQISRLRKKIDKNFSKPLVHTLRGKGYILSACEPDQLNLKINVQTLT